MKCLTFTVCGGASNKEVNACEISSTYQTTREKSGKPTFFLRMPISFHQINRNKNKITSLEEKNPVVPRMVSDEQREKVYTAGFWYFFSSDCVCVWRWCSFLRKRIFWIAQKNLKVMREFLNVLSFPFHHLGWWWLRKESLPKRRTGKFVHTHMALSNNK